MAGAKIDPDCPLTRLRIAVLTISDARDQTDDRLRDRLAERISSAVHDLRARALRRDDKAASFHRKHFAICSTSNSKGSPYVLWHLAFGTSRGVRSSKDGVTVEAIIKGIGSLRNALASNASGFAAIVS